MAATPPPRPVVNHVLPAPRHAGVPGLENHELLRMAGALAQQRPRDEEDYLARALAHEVARRGLADQLRDAAARNARQGVDDFLDRAAYPYSPTDCWAMPGPDLTAGSAARGVEYDEPPW